VVRLNILIESYMESLTKENFWDEMEQKYPKAMAHFKEWIDEYKNADKGRYYTLFNAGITSHLDSDTKQTVKTRAPKYHELPIAMQFGIFLEWACDFAVDNQVIVGDIGFTTPNYKIGVADSITHLLLMADTWLESLL